MLRLGNNTNNFVADFPSPITTSPPPPAPPPAGITPSDDHDVHQPHEVYKLFVGSWNVGGISPPLDLDIRDWLNLHNDDAEEDGAGPLFPDIYVLGFQEIVPLNAGNIILGSTENINNNNIAMRWNSIIGAALNRDINNDVRSNFEGYECLVSKQMVGIFITVWIRTHLLQQVTHTAVSCVGCGLMGRLGNKGSVSVRFLVEKTSFCFVCSHLASGGREGDERYRNSDAGEILSRTNFRRPPGHLHNLPRKILHHDRVVWLGDLNYRIYLPEATTRFLVQKGEWNVLLEKDQLKAELRRGRVFDGWNEGSIQFAPTYKYCASSGVYYGFDSLPQYCHSRPSKGRAPAWCDRIIWFGEGLKQSQYGRGENRLSDHRPIRAIFTAQVDQKISLLP